MATSFNGGSTWSTETVVLQPSTTPGAGDGRRVCDPAIVKDGRLLLPRLHRLRPNNHPQLFVARAINPGGPFTKWNGTGWTGGAPAPLIDRDTIAAGPSLVNRAGTIHLFYNTRITTGPAAGTYQTRHATATLGTDPSTWPTRLTADPGVALTHPGKYTGTDCVGSHWWADTDVKYDETTGKYLAITTDQSTYRWSALQAYESTDGTTFTRAIITRGDYQARRPQPRPARRPLRPPHPQRHQSHRLRPLHRLRPRRPPLHGHHPEDRHTGAITEPLATSAANWHPDSGTWQISPGGYYEQTQSVEGATSESSLSGRALSASSVIAVALRTGDQSVTRAGVHFGKAHPDDTISESGYFASVDSTGNVCLEKAGFGQMGDCDHTMAQAGEYWVQMRIVQANGSIKVYLNGKPAWGIAVTDAHHPYLGGYVGLVTRHTWGRFANFNAWDNLRGVTSADDCTPTLGIWWMQDAELVNSRSYGECLLLDSTGLASSVTTQLGDGTYAATLRIIGHPPTPDGWAGVVFSENAAAGWREDGYLVFLRLNGNLGVFKAGTGQVVADVPTGTDPRTTGVPIRVIKTHENLQVFVGDGPDPLVNWSDPTAPQWSIGAFGLANLGAAAGFANITYDGNDAR